jgi:hypothetical protein
VSKPAKRGLHGEIFKQLIINLALFFCCANAINPSYSQPLRNTPTTRAITGATVTCVVFAVGNAPPDMSLCNGNTTPAAQRYNASLLRV